MFHSNWKCCVLLTLTTLALSGCIGATPARASATRSEMGRDARHAAPRGVSNNPAFCEPPEMTTGDLTPVDSAPCGSTFVQSQQVTAGPPQIRHY